MRSSKQSALENVSISPALDNYNTMGAALLPTVKKYTTEGHMEPECTKHHVYDLITVGLVCGMALLTFENVDQHHIFN